MVPLAYVDEVYEGKLKELEQQQQRANKTIMLMQQKVSRAMQAEEEQKAEADYLKNQNNDLKKNFHRTLVEKLNGKTLRTPNLCDEIEPSNDQVLMT